MSDGDDLAPVVQLRPGQDVEDDARPLATGPRPKPTCWHHRTELDGEARRVHCRDCGREVPAFDVLSDLARDWERYIHGRKEAERRCKVVEALLSDLLRDERNAKARRRSWKRHEPEAVRHLRAVMELLTRYRPPSHPATVAAQAFLDGDTAACSSECAQLPRT